MKKTVLIIALIMLAGGVALYLLFSGSPATGYMETTGVVELKEVELAPERGGRIVWLCCEEGEPIKRGAPVLRLDDAKLRAQLKEALSRTDELRAKIEAARKELEALHSIVDSLGAALEGIDEEIGRAGALLEDARKDLARFEALYSDGIATEKELDAAKTKTKVLEKDVAILERRKERLLSEKKAKRAELEAQRLRIKSMRAGLKELEAQKELIMARLKELEVLSPIDGVVVYKAFEVGEVVQPATPVYTVHDRSHIWVRVDIEETLIGRVRLHTKARVTLPAMPDEPFEAEVREINPLAGFATQRDVKRGRPDIKTFRVKLSIKDGKKELLKHGMTVNVRIY